MTIRHLKIFKEVCDCQSVTKAAEKLYIAQPSVSVVISDIEKQFDVMLFQRLNHRLIITEAGKRLYEKACAALKAFSEFETAAARESSADCVRIGASLTVGTYMIPRLIENVRSRFPDVKIVCRIFQTNIIEKLLISGEIDFGMVEKPISSPNAEAVGFYEDTLVAVCGKNFGAPDKLSLKDLASYPFILREKGSAARDCFDMFLDRYRIEIQPLVETVNPLAAVHCAISNIGIAVLPLSNVSEYLQRNILRQLTIEKADLIRTYFLIKNKQSVLTPLQNEIFSMCNELIGTKA